MNSRASIKGNIPLSIEDARKLEKLLNEISNKRYLNDKQKRKAQKHAILLKELLRRHASGWISLPSQVILAILQCLKIFFLRHSIEKGLGKLMGD